MLGLGSIRVGASGSNLEVFNFTLTANDTDYNLNTDLVARGWDGVKPVGVTCTIDTGVEIESTSTSTPGFEVDALPEDSVVTIINNGLIDGKGGAGGGAQSAGAPGGTALDVAHAITFDNTNGEINGGGGGGGGGGNATGHSSDGKSCVVACNAGGGAGGAGYGPGAAGSGSGGSCCGSCDVRCGGSGSAGGDKGAVGGGSGGAAGNSVVGDSNITWTATGIRNGPIS